MSSNNEYAIQVQDVSKIYKLYDKPIDRLKESLSLTHKNYHKDFFALSDISFNVKKGETVGIIGTNGSGKSTILKIITGVLTPTSGQVRVSGVISALLELGAGFNMDYTGIENIYMNGTMMGFSKKQMDEKLPDILEFADRSPFSAMLLKRSLPSPNKVRSPDTMQVSPDCWAMPLTRLTSSMMERTVA